MPYNWTQPIQISLQALPAHISAPTQVGITCKLSEGALDPLINSTDKTIKTGPSNEPWGALVVTSHQLDLTPFTMMLTLYSLL